MAKNVPTRDTGIATRTISEERHRRRNRKSTRDVVMMLSTRFSRVSSSDELMKRVASLATVTAVPGGSVGPRAASSSFTAFAVVTTLASLCLRTRMPMVGCSFSRTVLRGSGYSRATRATWERRTLPPPAVGTRRLRTSSMPANSPTRRTDSSRAFCRISPAGMSRFCALTTPSSAAVLTP